VTVKFSDELCFMGLVIVNAGKKTEAGTPAHPAPLCLAVRWLHMISS